MNSALHSIVHRRGERGVALVTALLVVALATVAAVAMATRLHVDLRRAGNLLHGEQAYTYALAAESWAQVILERDANDNKSDSLEDDWATSLPPIAVEGGLVDGQVSDLQGRFNVNNLVDGAGNPDVDQREYFERLLDNLQLDVSLAAALLDWVDRDTIVTFGGIEDDGYLLLDPPYRAANRRLVDISELRLVQGFTAEVIETLAPHVTALPATTAINVNTASVQTLLSLHEDLNLADIQALVEAREDGAYENINEFEAEDALAGLDPPIAVGIGVESEWFQVLTDVIVGAGRARLNTLLNRDSGATRVIMRTRARHYLLPPPDAG
ncbi:MAG: type II secretion system minor pseudopilin GspK [Gammaproteobacteria bacterium]|nr:type II secretion system minor pseudopilin GspK [Gammaproteobacteria bacterium]